MADHPKDKNLRELLARLNEKLEVAYKKECDAIVTNPLNVAIELMSLNEEDMEQWVQIFEKIDKAETGKITLDQLFEYLESPKTELLEEVFHSVDAVDENGGIEFGDLLRAIGTYCFFGKVEIVK
jgi:hypothetical protein